MIWRRRDAICMPDNYGKNTDTHSVYLVPIAVPLQQWLLKHASLLRHMYTVCLIHSVALLRNTYILRYLGRVGQSL